MATYAAATDEILYLNHQEFVKNVFENSNGRLLIDIYLAGTLGYSVFEHHRVTGEGFIEIGEGTSAAATEEPVFGVFSQVSLYQSRQDIDRAWEYVIGDLEKAAAKFNTKILWGVCKGYDQWNSTVALPTVDSFKGVKMRAWNPVLASWIEAMGGTPLVIPYAERYTSLATGVVQANACAPLSIIDTKDFEVTDYYNLWPLQPIIYVAFMNLDAYNKLPADLQDLIMEEARIAADKLRLTYDSREKAAMDQLGEVGVEIIEPAPEELAKMRKITEEKIWASWRGEAGPEANALLDRVIEFLGY